MLNYGLFGCSVQNYSVAKLFVLLTLFCQLLALPELEAASNQSELDNNCLQVREQIKGENMLAHIAHFWDADGKIQAPDKTAGHTLSQTAGSYRFELLKNLGDRAPLKHTQSNHWFRFCLSNPTSETVNIVVALSPPSLSEVDFYPQKPGLPSFKTGNTQPVSSRDIPNNHFDFNIRLTSGETQTFYMRVNTVDNPFIQAEIWDRTSYDRQNNMDEILWGIYVGVFGGLVIYHLLLLLSARQLTSFLFIVWSTSIFMLLSSLQGRLVQILFPNYPQLSQLGVDIFYPISTFLSAVLFGHFMQLKRYDWLNRIANGLLVCSALLLVFAYANGSLAYAKTLDAVAVVIACFFGLWAPIYALIKDRLDAAKYIIFTLAPLIVVLVDRTLFSLEISSDFFITFDLKIAIVCAMIILSYYIGLVVYQEKQVAQRNALEQLNISNTLKSNYNSQLEQELEEKTEAIRSMNADLEQQAQKLLQLDESKSKFFANISHEFRTPLTLIEGPLNMLIEEDGSGDTVITKRSTVKGLLKHSQSLKRLIDEILLLSELDENALDLRASRVNVVDVTRSFVAQFESICQQKGIVLSCQADQANIQAYIDYEKLQIVLNNMLSNAIKFTGSAGRITVAVSSTVAGAEPIDGYSADEYIQILVSDTGHGIPEHELEHVFDRYFQSESSELSKSGIGTGIGLALVKELVELHAGTVQVESVCKSDVLTESKGSTQSGTQFCITFPLGRAHLNDNEIISEMAVDSAHYEQLMPMADVIESSSESTETLSPVDQERPIVLVVDDNDDMRQHISQILATQYDIITAADGLLAEAALKEQMPALIITDLMMPNRNGLEFVQSIKTQPQFANIPIIMLTARAGLQDRLKGLMAAVDDYLIKPFNGRELKARVQNLLNKQAQFNAFYQTANDQFLNKGKPSADDLSPIKVDGSSETFLDKVKTAVDARLMLADYGVEDLAQDMFMSEATLRRRIAEHANFTPAAFIRHCRLEKARQLIAEGDITNIAEVAHSVGFKNSGYFARLYRKTFNCDVELPQSNS